MIIFVFQDISGKITYSANGETKVKNPDSPFKSDSVELVGFRGCAGVSGPGGSCHPSWRSVDTDTSVSGHCVRGYSLVTRLGCENITIVVTHESRNCCENITIVVTHESRKCCENKTKTKIKVGIMSSPTRQPWPRPRQCVLSINVVKLQLPFKYKQ